MFQGYKQKTKHPTGERLEKRKKKMKETEAQAKLSLKLQAYQGAAEASCCFQRRVRSGARADRAESLRRFNRKKGYINVTS